MALAAVPLNGPAIDRLIEIRYTKLHEAGLARDRTNNAVLAHRDREYRSYARNFFPFPFLYEIVHR